MLLDGKHVLCSLRDGGLRLFDAEDGREVRRWQAHMPIVNVLCIGGDGRLALAAGTTVPPPGQGDDAVLCMWGVETGRQLGCFPAGVGDVRGVALTPDGRRAAAGSEGVLLCDARTGEEVCRFRGHRSEVTSVAVSPDGRFALSGGADGTARFWRLPR